MYFRQKKVIEPEYAIKKLANSENLVFTSGVFDILHFGHIQFLRMAKNIVKNKGHLLVALHDDVYVRQIKGKGRPYTNINERVEILSELLCVDYVTIWSGWESIIYLAQSLRPKYFALTEKNYDHTKTGKWTSKTWDEVAKEINAEIVRIPVFKNYSSSLLINKTNEPLQN